MATLKEHFEPLGFELGEVGRGLFYLIDRKGSGDKPIPFREDEIHQIAACKDVAAARQRFFEISLTPIVRAAPKPNG